MFDSIFEYIIIFIPIAIFIGRMVSKARKKNQAPPPKVPQPQISVHFEDDDYRDDTDYDEDYRDYSEHISKEPVRNIPMPAAWASPLAPAISVNLAEKTPVTIPVLPRKKDFAFNLSHLSPLKQAVVMAEILGSPKGLT